MIDQEKLAEVRTRLRGGDTPKDPLSSLTPSELRRLRSEVDKLLPQSEGLNDLNLETELVDQYNLVKQLQSTAINDDDIPLNQRSQLAGQVASTLAQLVKMQVDLKRDERLKKIEALLLEAITTLPDDVRDKFFAEYEDMAKVKGVSA